MIDLLKDIGLKSLDILIILCLCYYFREGIKKFFAEKILEHQTELNEKRDEKDREFQKELSKQNFELQDMIQSALEKQKAEFEKELREIDYKNDYYKKIIDKRMRAYEEIISVFLKWSGCSHIGSSNYKYSIFLSDNNSVNNIIDGLEVIQKNKFWISKKMRKVLHNYSIFISVIGTCLRSNDLTYNALIEYLNNNYYKDIEDCLNLEFKFDEIKNNLINNENLLKQEKFLKIINTYDLNLKALIISMSVQEQINAMNEKIIIMCYDEFLELSDVEVFLKELKNK